MYPQTQTRHSHTGLWASITIIAGAVIFSAIVIIAIFIGLNKVKDSGPTPARFYLALQGQNYALAYAYLDGQAKVNNQPVNQQTFIEQMAQADATTGAISGFSYEDKQDNSNVTVKVTRANRTYDVHFQLKQVDGRWLITSIDKL